MKLKYAFVLITLLSTLPVSAQEAPAPSASPNANVSPSPASSPDSSSITEEQPFFLTLTEAIGIAQESNHDIKLAIERIEDARLQISETGAQGLPQVSAAASYGRQDPVLAQQTTDVSSGAGAGAGLGNNPQFAAFLGTASVNTFNSSITVNQTLFAGFRVLDGLRIAQINLDLQQQALRQTRQNVAYQVTNAYFTALRSWESVAVDKENLDLAREQVRIAEVKLKAGAGLKLDLLQAQSQELQVQQRLSLDLASYEKAKMSLNQVIGRETLHPIELNTFATVADYKTDAKQGLETALENRADLRQFRLQREISEINATIQGRAVWPTLSAQVRYNLQDNAVAGGNNRSVQNLNYGLNLNWPIFDGFAAQAKAQRAQQTALQAQISLDQAQQRVILDIEQSLLDIREALEREQMALASLDLAQETLRVSQVSYREGAGLMLNIINAQLSLQQGQTALINARYDLNTRKARLYQALGLDLVDHLK